MVETLSPRRSKMYRLFSAATIACVPLLLGGCDDAVRPLAPQLEAKIAGGEQRRVQMLDACDPESFNAAIGPGTCIRQGGVQFGKFLTLLGKHQKVGAWHFAPATVHVRVGQELLAVNQGGEVHTFTEVEEFGGGLIPDLNALAGTPVPAPECLALAPGDFVPPGGTFSDEVEEAGTELYECCIHPWMRAVVTARD
jgi:plastocyanin